MTLRRAGTARSRYRRVQFSERARDPCPRSIARAHSSRRLRPASASRCSDRSKAASAAAKSCWPLPATTPAPLARTISAAPTRSVTTTGRPRIIASATTLPKFSDIDGRANRRAAANKASLSAPPICRGRNRTRSPTPDCSARLRSFSAKPSSSLPAMSALAFGSSAIARISRSRPFFQLILPKLRISKPCATSARTSGDIASDEKETGASTPLGMMDVGANASPRSRSARRSSSEVR